MYLGIDNATSGGIVLIDRTGHAHDKWEIPTTYELTKSKKRRNKVDEKLLFFLIVKICIQYKIKKIFIEKPLIFNTQLATSSTWFTFGVYMGIFAAMNLNYEPITVHSWQKMIGKKFGIRSKTDVKQLAIKFALENSNKPEDWWKRNARCKIVHDGFTDAYGIAVYGISKLES